MLQAGWTAVELLVALAVSGLLCGSMIQAVAAIQQCAGKWERAARMRAVLSAALFMMERDVRMAGCNPTGRAVFGGILADGSSDPSLAHIEVRMDKRGAEPGTRPDGDIGDPNEIVSYEWESADATLRRNRQPMAVRIVANPGGEPMFEVIEDPGGILVRIRISTWIQDHGLSLSSAVRVRNRTVVASGP